MTWTEVIQKEAELTLYRDTRKNQHLNGEFRPLRVGDTIYVYDENKRVYPSIDRLIEQPWKGLVPPKHLHAPIWRAHFVPEVIKYENRVSWFTCAPNDPNHIKKESRYPKLRGVAQDHKLRQGLLGFEYYISQEEINEAEFLHEIRPQVARLVETIINPEMLHKIVRMMHLDDFKYEDWPGWGR